MQVQSPFFIGVTRFSLFIPGSASWNLSRNGSEEEYLSALYAPERLDSRIDIFLNISLPQLAQAIEGHHVRHIVQYSSTLPIEYQNKLLEAAEKYPFLRIFCNDSREQHSRIIDDTAAEFAKDLGLTNYVYAWFRIDDDDVLATTYFEQVAEYVAAPNAGKVVSLGLGYSAIYHDGHFWDIREDYRPKSSIGQLYVCRFDSSSNSVIQPPRQNHALIDKWAPTILDSRKPSFITVLHANQDGHARGAGSEAFAKLDLEQERRPYLTEIPVLPRGFEAIPKEKFGKKTTLLEARRTASTEPLPLSTNPQEFNLNLRGSLSIDFEVDSSLVQSDARFFISVKFNPGECPEPAGRWQQFDKSTLVQGFPFSRISQAGRAQILRHENVFNASRISVWTSKNYEGKAALRYLRIVQS